MKGDFGKLAQMRAMFARLNASAVPDLARLLGAEAVTQVQMGFRSSEDPNGQPWAPLAWRTGRPLLDTGRLRSSFTANINRSGFEIGTNVGYSVYHQYGARIRRRARGLSRGRVGRLPARPMLPTSSRLGLRWTSAFEDVANRFVSRIFKR